LGGRIPGALIGVLLRDRLRGEQALPALVGGARQLLVGIGRREIRLRLAQLLIHLRRVDLGEHPSLLHRRADVGVPVLEVPAGARVDRRLVEGLDGARQHQSVRARTRFRLHGRDGGHRGGCGLALERVAGADPAHDAPHGEHERGREPDERVAAHACIGQDGVRGGGQLGHQVLRRPWTSLNTVGTKKSVATVAKMSPPITARPSGAFCSPPSPRPSAIGTMPVMMMNGSSQDWKLTTISRYTSTIAAASPSSSPAKDSVMVFTCPCTATCEPRGSELFDSASTRWICAATKPRSLPSTAPKMSTTGVAS